MLTHSVALAALLGLAQAAVFHVVVGIDETNGQPGRGFDPSVIYPSVGDTITFSFAMPAYIKDPPTFRHSATESTFANPCTAGGGGFDTGVQTTGSENSGTGASFDFTVEDANPRWFFSAGDGDCKSGMVFAVNPEMSGEQTAHALQENARSSPGPEPEPLSSVSTAPDSGTLSTVPQSSATSTSATTTAVTGSTTSSGEPVPTDTQSNVSESSANGSRTEKMELVFAGLAATIGLALLA